MLGEQHGRGKVCQLNNLIYKGYLLNVSLQVPFEIDHCMLLHWVFQRDLWVLGQLGDVSSMLHYILGQ
jgi:hypothetical protein